MTLRLDDVGPGRYGTRSTFAYHRREAVWGNGVLGWFTGKARWRNAGSTGEVVYPGLDAGTAIYAVGDIHGRSDLLDRVHQAIDADLYSSDVQRYLEIYLGDYIDRGSDSAGVIARLRRRSLERPMLCLLGNHEAILRDVLAGEIEPQVWLGTGGDATALSYGVDPRTSADIGESLRLAIPAEDVAFLHNLRPSFHYGPYFFAHAGVRPGVALDAQALDDLIWIREPFLHHSGPFGAIVVHGHTPHAEPQFRANRINIDSAAFATNRLSCIRIDGNGVRLLAA